VSDTDEDPVRKHPAVVRVRVMLVACDPDVLAVVDDVDRTLIVVERMRSSVETALLLERWARRRSDLSKS
jgi:hypothetical protein